MKSNLNHFMSLKSIYLSLILSISQICKRCLSSLSFSFKDGPWKHTYVKYGYDPRGDPNSIIYQVIDVGMIDKQAKYETLNLSYKRNEL